MLVHAARASTAQTPPHTLRGITLFGIPAGRGRFEIRSHEHVATAAAAENTRSRIEQP
jgi:hypothetical protein